MRRLKSLFLFFISFSLEVRVKAESTQQHLLQKPEACLAEKNSISECFFSSTHAKETFNFDSLKLHLFDGSLAKKMGPEVHVIQGEAVVVFNETGKFYTPYGWMEGKKGTQVWVDLKNEKMTLINLKGQVFLYSQKKKVELLEKFKMSVWNTMGTKEANYSVPFPVHSEEFLKIKLSLFDKSESKKEFLSSLKEDQEEIADLTEKSSQLYKKIIDRHIASAEETRQHQLKKEARQQKKRQELKQLYYQKVFER